MGRKGRRKKVNPAKVVIRDPEFSKRERMIIEAEAKSWARDYGLLDPIKADAEKTYFGYACIVRETEGKGRSASCRFDKDGKRTMWELHQSPGRSF